MKKIAIILFLLFTSLPAFASSIEDEFNITKFNQYDDINDMVYSDNGSSFAFEAVKGTKSFIVKDGVENRKYDYSGTPKYSPDGKHFAYIAEQDGKYFVVKDGVEGERYYNMWKLLYFSPDGKHFAYIAEQDGKYFVVKDGVEEKKYKCNSIDYVMFSKNGNHLSYVINNFYGNNILVKDGIESEKYDSIDNPTYSPDGNSFLFRAYKDGKRIIIKDGAEINKYDMSTYPVYSPDSKHFVYLAKQDGKYFVVKDGVEGEKYDEINCSGYFFLSNSKTFVYIAKKDGKYFVVKDGVEGEKYNYISGLYKNNNGDNYSLVVQKYIKERKDVIITDGVESKQFDLIFWPIYSPDGKGYSIFAADITKSSTGSITSIMNFINRDGVKEKLYSEIDNPNYSFDGKHLEYRAKQNGKQFIVIDGIEGDKIDDYSTDYLEGLHTIAYSTNGSNYAIKGKISNKVVLITYMSKNGIIPDQKLITQTNYYQLNDSDKAFGEKIFGRVNNIILKKSGDRNAIKEKYIVVLNNYKIMTKNLKIKAIIDYVIKKLVNLAYTPTNK